jgi:CheY-like chemotaxis protein
MDRSPLRRVLLVEDDPDIQVVASLALAELGGLTVEVCGSGARTLDAAQSFRPDLILLDVMMPDMDGISALKELREDPILGETPVVFMTARAQPHEVAHYRNLGSLGVITKPFEPESLAEKVRCLWDQRP